MLDAEDEENSEGMCNIDHEAASPYTIHTAVLPKPSLIDANINSAIMDMLDIVQPKNDDVNKDLMRNMPETDQLFRCHLNQVSLLWN
jgi:hypothetical protein